MKVVVATDSFKESGLEPEMRDADWIITCEGKFDSQPLNGKVMFGIVQAAKRTDTRVAVIAGDVQPGRDECHEFGLAATFGLRGKGMAVEYAMRHSEELLKRRACEFVETILKKQTQGD